MSAEAADGPAGISVALCTYNGARYLAEQLDSIAAQNVLPAELVACDDGSTDATLAILESFARSAPFPVRIERNSANLGPAQNFAKAISLCSAGWIVLADQDDVWLGDKLERLLAAVAARPEAAVFSDAEVVDEDLRPLGYSMWQRVGLGAAKLARFDAGEGWRVLLRHFVVTGATLMFRAELRPLALPIPPLWMHDAWIALIAAAAGGIVACPQPLIRYRQHGANAIGGRRIGLRARLSETVGLDPGAYYEGEIARYESAAQRLASCPAARCDVIRALQAKIAHLRARAALPPQRWRRVAPILREALGGGYARYSAGWRVAVKDLLLPGRGTN